MKTCIDKKGVSLTLRPIEMSDISLLYDFYMNLSTRSILSFYQGGMSKSFLTSTEKLLVECQPQKNDFRLVVLDGDKIIGVGMLLRMQVKALKYEIAYLISDKYQGRGIGTLIMNELEARVRSYCRGATIVAYVSTSNIASRKILRNSGLGFKPDEDEGMLSGKVE